MHYSVTRLHIYTWALWNFEDSLELACMSNRPRNLWAETVFSVHYVDVFVLNFLNAIMGRTFFHA
jgi:hypothetical protein